jgi:ATP-dependent helicase/nuclease subunit A
MRARRSKMNLTEEQKLAIESPIKNIAINAGAGSGKTSVLTSRILKLIKDGVKLDELLVLTFTDAASQEMKERIKGKLANDPLSEIRDEVPYVDSAHIQTYDSYFLYLVKRYADRLSLTRDVNIVPDDVITVKKREAIDKELAYLYDNLDDERIDFIAEYTQKDDSKIVDFIARIGEVLKRNPEIGELSVEDYFKKFKEAILLYGNDRLARIKDLTLRLSDDKNIASIEEFLKVMEGCEDCESFLARYENVPSVRLYKKEDDENVIDEINDFRKDLKDLSKGVDLANLESFDLVRQKKYLPRLVAIAKKANEEVESFKRKCDYFTFEDIARMAYDLVANNEDIRLYLKNKYKTIMIDEYQDTSAKQEAFISLIANDNLFLVGDVKQSIYGFREAEPSIFKKKLHDFKFDKDKGLVIDLMDNFRSCKEVIVSVNEIFKELMSERCGGVNYRGKEELRSSNRAYDETKSTAGEFGVFRLPFDSKDQKDTSEIEAETIAKSIESKIAKKEKIIDRTLKDNHARKLRYSDFAILIAKKTKFETYTRVFSKYGIPLNVIDSETITKNGAVMPFLDIYKFLATYLDSAMNPILKEEHLLHYFVAIVRSFIFSYSDQKIYDLVSSHKYTEDEAYLKLVSLADEVGDITLVELFDKIMSSFKFIERLSLTDNGLSYLDTLNLLYSRTKTMDELGYSLEEFVSYLNELNTYGLSIDVKHGKSSSNSVTLSSIHQAKGLEYNVVYLPGLYEKSNKDKGKAFYVDEKDGIFLKVFSVKKPTTLFKIFKKDNDLNYNSEALRLFYVALTRAENEAILLEDNKQPFGSKSKGNGFSYFLNKLSFKLDELSKVEEISSLSATTIEKEKTSKKVQFYEFIALNSEKKAETRASKFASPSVDGKLLRYGTHLHSLMEIVDLKIPDLSFIKDERDKRIIAKVVDMEVFKDLQDAKIYKEYQYVGEDGIEGVIDLLVEKKDICLLFDYKTKNIEDVAYVEQVTKYSKYVEKKFNKKCVGYLLSLKEGEIKEVYRWK